MIENRELEELVVDLQTRGARIDVPGEARGRRGGAGPADAKAFVIDGIPFTVPTMADFVERSPYAVEAAGDGYVVTRRGLTVVPVAFAPRPRFYDLQTGDGIPYWHLATLHATDVLASTIVQTCIRWNDPADRCRYCGIGISLSDRNTVAVKKPEHLAEVAEAAVRLDGVKHFTMTMGTLNETDKGARYMARCVRAVRADVPGLPIEVQFEPPDDLGLLREVREAGADSIGIHIEAFDQTVRERITPGKARVTVESYFRAFGEAVKVFGEGQVSSYVLVGLGEPPESILEGCRRLVDLGVYPFVVPLRPIVGTEMEDVPAPEPEVMDRIYRAVEAMLARRSMSHSDAHAGCVRCGACSALPAYARERLGSAGRTQQIVEPSGI
jgi:radical SAM protein (TIGR04043 family)